MTIDIDEFWGQVATYTPAPLLKDFYKAGHIRQYPEHTTLVYSNFTPRSSRMDGVDEVVFFGLQAFLVKYLILDFDENFFDRPKDEVVAKYKRRMDNALGPDAINVDHIAALHDLGYLPLLVKALPEGTRVPLRVPVLTIRNTKPEFFWLTNMLETILSTSLWLACTSATIADQYRKTFDYYADLTVGDRSFTDWQAHDFSYRGMGMNEASIISGAAHLLSSFGTDTIPAIDFLEQFYFANSDNEMVGGSVAATEHSVMCMGGMEGEEETFRRLLVDVYPTGIVSIVSDTWDFWEVITGLLPRHKDIVLARDGKAVIRPDSGDPVKIICGDPNATPGSPEFKGAIECLWETFGGTVTEKGYKLLDSHIGLIYGDSITLERQKAILSGLAAKGFASYNVVLGVGSFTYQYNTRDTFGFAMKATYGEVAHVGRDIFKDPKTDDGVKKSAKGLIRVYEDDGVIGFEDQQTWMGESQGLLQTVFLDGELLNVQSLAEIRERLAATR